MLKHIDEKNFTDEVLNKKGVCVVDFYATWCGPCMMLSPILEEISRSRSGCEILKINVDENPNIANELKIDSIPALFIYKDGKLVEKQIGLLSKDDLIELIEKYN